MAKVGRPLKAANKRDQSLHIRLTADEKTTLEQLAKTEGGTITDLITKVIRTAGDRSQGAADIWNKGAHERPT